MSTTSPVSIASSSSAAAAGGSVIDVNSIVSQLVSASRAPKDAAIASKTKTVTTQISALSKLKAALSTFQDSLSAISTPTAFNLQAATSSNPAVFTATATSDAAAGSYSVSVSQLAQAQQLVSTPFVGGTGATTVGTGTLQVSLGGTTFNVTIDSTHNTLAGIASAISSAPGNPGIKAAVVTGTDGAHLILTSAQSGAVNTIKVTETDGGTGLAAITYGTGNTANYTEASQAKDAIFNVSGIPHSSPGNTVTDAVPGVTLNLVGTTAAGTGPGSTAQLTVSSDTQTIATNIQAFVDAYNAMVKTVAPLGSYDKITKTAGPMLGDPAFTGIQNEIRSALHSVVNTGSDTYNTLASVGITTNADGTLSLSKFKLQTALSAAPAAVSSLFSSTNGVAASLNSRLTDELGAGGVLANRSKTLVTQSNALSDQTADLDKQMAKLTQSLTQQYAQLNTLLSSLQSMSAYLSQQFASLPTVQQNK